jgi:hypothetical protein
MLKFVIKWPHARHGLNEIKSFFLKKSDLFFLLVGNIYSTRGVSARCSGRPL